MLFTESVYDMCVHLLSVHCV